LSITCVMKFSKIPVILQVPVSSYRWNISWHMLTITTQIVTKQWSYHYGRKRFIQFLINNTKKDVNSSSSFFTVFKLRRPFQGLHSVGQRRMNDYGKLEHWCWRGRTEVFGARPLTVPFNLPQISHSLGSILPSSVRGRWLNQTWQGERLYLRLGQALVLWACAYCKWTETLRKVWKTKPHSSLWFIWMNNGIFT